MLTTTLDFKFGHLNLFRILEIYAVKYNWAKRFAGLV